MSDGSRWVEGERPEANTCQVLLAPSGVGRLAAKQPKRGFTRAYGGYEGLEHPAVAFANQTLGGLPVTQAGKLF